MRTRKTAESALRESEERYRAVVAALEEGIVLLERDGSISSCNASAARILGRTEEELVGMTCTELQKAGFHEDGSICEPSEFPGLATLRTGEPRSQAVLGLDRPDGQRVWISVNSRPLFRPGEPGPYAVVVSFTDITSRRRTEEERARLQDSLRNSETMSAMGALVAGVAHEVRNPLFGISATLDAFESRFENRAEFRRYFEILKERVQRLNELMQQLLDYGKPLCLELEDVCLRKVAREAIQACAPVAAAAEVEIAAKLASEMPPLRGDRMRILQVFENILENAVQHSPRGGRVIVRVGCDGDGRARFSVEDSGSGFRPEDLDRIYEPFFSRRRGGTGLGLSIVQRIVEQHQGEVRAANRPEGGAVMSVTLPLSQRTSGLSGP